MTKEQNRREWQQEADASHCRGEAEDRHNERMRLFREIDKGMKKYVVPVAKQEFSNEPF